MTTIIDELVVSLRLDSTQFTAAQRNAISSLRGFDQQVQGTTRNIGGSASELRGYFAAIENPIAALKAAFIDIAAGSRKSREENKASLTTLSGQARRSGEAVRAGALSGAEGFTAMAAAGLAAVAAIKAVQMAMTEVHETATKTAQFGRAAYYTGLGTREGYQWLGGLTGYGRTRGISESTTTGALNQFEQARSQFREFGTGPFAEMAIAFGRLGIPFDQNAPLQQILPQIANAIAGQHGPEAQLYAGMVGLGPILNMLQPGGAALNQGIARYSSLAPTADEIRAAGQFEAALGDLENHFEKLHRQIMQDLAPALVTLMGTLTQIIDFFTLNTDKLGAMLLGPILGPLWASRPHAPGSTGGAGTTVPGVPPPVAAPATPFSIWNPSTWFGGGKTSAVIPGSASGSPGALAAATLSGAALLTSLGVSSGSPEWQIAMRESRGNPNIGWSGLPGRPEYSPGGTDLTNVPLDQSGFPKWGGKMGPAGNSTAAGLWMITKSNWDVWAPRLGIHDFSPQSQLRVMQAMRDANRGYGDWAASGTTSFEYTGSNYRNFTAPTSAPDTFSGMDANASNFWNYNQQHPNAMVTWQQYLDMIQQHQAGGAGGASTANNDNSIENHYTMHHVEVNTKASNGYEVGTALQSAFRSQVVLNSDTGRE